MKKVSIFMISVMVILFVVSCGSEINVTPFKVGDVYYQSLQEACEAAILADSKSAEGTESIVEIVRDASGPGICIKAESASLPIPLMINLSNHSYTVTETESASNSDFDITGIMLIISADEGKLTGSGSTLFSINNSYLTISGSLDIEVPEGVYFADADKESSIYFDAFLDGTVSGNINLNESKMYILTKDGELDIDRLSLSGSGSQLIFGAARNTENTCINSITMDKNAQSVFSITTSQKLNEDEYGAIDKIIENSGWTVHRHGFKDVADDVYLEATCSSNRYEAFKCTVDGCDYVDYREVADSINSNKHKLVHVNEVKPTATTTGVQECEVCEWCHSYFDSKDSNTPIFPILLATDNVPYLDMNDSMALLKTTLQDLEASLKPIETKDGGLTAISILISVISTSLKAVEMINGGAEAVIYSPDIQKMFSELNEVNGRIGNLQYQISELSSKLENISNGNYLNERIRKLNAFSSKTKPYYSAIIETITSNKSKTEKQNKVKELVNQCFAEKNCVISEPTILLKDGLLRNNEQSMNLFQVYDAVGRTSTGWEHLSLDYRIALRAYDMITMLEGYQLAEWYYRYCYEGNESVKNNALKDLRSAWEDYKDLYENNPMETDSTHITCWLSNNHYTFERDFYQSNYQEALSVNPHLYFYTSPENNKANIDALIKNADGECMSIKFFEEVYTWYNDKRAENEKKNIYQIFEILGFGVYEREKTKLSDFYNKNMFIVADPGRNTYNRISDSQEHPEVSYRMINFSIPLIRLKHCWFAVGSVLDTNMKYQKKYICDECDFRFSRFLRSYNPYNNKFYTLHTAKFTPETV